MERGSYTYTASKQPLSSCNQTMTREETDAIFENNGGSRQGGEYQVTTPSYHTHPNVTNLVKNMHGSITSPFDSFRDSHPQRCPLRPETSLTGTPLPANWLELERSRRRANASCESLWFGWCQAWKSIAHIFAQYNPGPGLGLVSEQVSVCGNNMQACLNPRSSL